MFQLKPAGTAENMPNMPRIKLIIEFFLMLCGINDAAY